MAQPDQHHPKRGTSTQAVHAGELRQKLGDSLIDPIVCSATYTFESTQSVIDFIEEDQPREEYGRYGNPGERIVERKLAALEQAEAGLLFSTGMSAITTLMMAKLSAGDEVIFFDECYHRSREFCRKHLSRFGVKTLEIKMGDYQALAEAITPKTRLLVSESPTNPHLSIVDLEQFVGIGRKHNIETVIDATLATPINLLAIPAGVDYVIHSATKYLGGHNDLLAGALVGSEAQLADVRALRGIMGCIASPHTCFLLQRGLKTLSLRMRQQNQNGQRVAEFLANHPRIEKVYYPGLPSHPYYELAKKTMTGFGGLITFCVKDADWKTTAQVVDAAGIPRIGPSLGGVESLIEQPLVMSYYKCPPEDRQAFGIADNMIRLSCGIEDTEDLIEDLRQALDGVGKE
ncbi:Aminotransferase class I/II-fold pyridoxal phosphate-dependent enzyme [Planctomycetales bacterium 10988]|nr:Aminotransferase class I/II-fold pyridoxal phosphate-dependent enzyme [Planctomycetales bacterium 10988]